MKQLPNKIIGLYFNDKTFQYWFLDGNITRDVEKGKDLYISFGQKKIDFFTKAFLSENSLWMMFTFWIGALNNEIITWKLFGYFTNIKW